MIQVLVHGREEAKVLIDVALEVPHHMAIQIEFALENEIRGHVLLESRPAWLVIDPHGAILFEHAMQFIQHLDLLLLILVLIQIVVALVVHDSVMPTALCLDIGYLEDTRHCALQTTLSRANATVAFIHTAADEK